jgi:hypothetical protein
VVEDVASTVGRSGVKGRRRKIQWLNRFAQEAYSPTTNVKGERRGKQGAEAVEPRGQKAEAEKERGRETSRRQTASDKDLTMVRAKPADVPRPAGRDGQRTGVENAIKLET